MAALRCRESQRVAISLRPARRGRHKPAHHSLSERDQQVGTVTSAAWCPTVKSNLAYAQIETPHGAVGTGAGPEIYYQRELLDEIAGTMQGH